MERPYEVLPHGLINFNLPPLPNLVETCHKSHVSCSIEGGGGEKANFDFCVNQEATAPGRIQPGILNNFDLISQP